MNICIHTSSLRLFRSYSAIKKNEILLFAATWMDLDNIWLSKISQRQVLYAVTCGIYIYGQRRGMGLRATDHYI